VLAFDVPDSDDAPTSEDADPPRRPSEPLEQGERYQLGDTIARGGMGEVLTAHDAAIGREVAIKRMRAANPSKLSLARFLREARIQGRLDHPAIVPVHELAYDDEGRPYFVMKKLAGTTLQEVISTRSLRFTRNQLLRAFADVCLALEFAHTRGVIHRDIKPANILLGDFGEVYVLDWGIARVPTDRSLPPGMDNPWVAEDESSVATRPGAAVGTPGYMAPEQLRGEEVDARADVYALGAVLFEILAKTPLHARKDALRSTLKGVDARPSSRVPDIAPELDEICVRATARKRNARIGSARELGNLVAQYLDGDRDLALRTKLAREHLLVALSVGDDETGRRIAMREAGRALALDPQLTEAAEVVGRLMLEPPKQIPAQVRAELDAHDRATTRRFTWNVVIMHASWFVVLMPLMLLLGLHDPFYFALFSIGAVIGLAAGMFDLWTGRDLTWVHTTIMLFLCALTARVMTPFLISPVMAAVNVVAFAFHPRARHARPYALVAVLSALTIVGMWAAEVLGLISPTMTYADGTLLLRSPLDGIEGVPVTTALAIYVPVAIACSALLAFTTAKVARGARERLHLQAWQVRQLVPERRVDG
jgi:serine/threonine-protein kinase